jgi:hypothetical protein
MAVYISLQCGYGWFYGRKAPSHQETDLLILENMGNTHTVDEWKNILCDCIRKRKSYGSKNPNTNYADWAGSHYFSSMVHKGFLIKV